MSIRRYLKHEPLIGANTYIDPSAVIIGNVDIGEDCSVWPFVSIRGDIHAIKIGQRTNIQDGSVLHVTHASDYHPGGYPLTIGNDVTVGHRATLHGCTLQDFCLIGMNAVILDGAVVGSEVIVGAGSLVPPKKVLESGFLWVGSPVVKKRPLTEEEKKFLRYSAQSYVKLKNNYLI